LSSLEGVQVTVYDDASTDGTADVARQFGANVIAGRELPEGWTGKCFACHNLSAVEGTPWLVFMDADTRTLPGFAEQLAGVLNETQADVVTGFPKILPGAGIEPAYLGWVPWILLATNPFGLVSATGRGHNRFKNGQFSAWRSDVLKELRPFEQCRSEVLEDVKIGRLLAKTGHPVEVLDLSRILEVKMYDNLKEAWKGMLKNSADIAPGFLGCCLFAGYLTLVAVGWALVPEGWFYLAGLMLSKFLTDRIVRQPVWTFPLIPLTCLAAAATVMVSYVNRRTRGREWKGRTY
jgi:glycosyltransferase involved in cell wall biosynthesis